MITNITMHFNKSIFHLVGDILVLNNNNDHNRHLQYRTSYSWPNGIVPFKFEDGFTESREAFIREKMNELVDISNNTLLFVPKTNEQYWVEISEENDGCYSYVGREELEYQPNVLNLGNGCLNTQIVKHELLHTLGFYHEHSRSDRDFFVEIITENIQEGLEANFDIEETSDTLGLSYDYNSIMHYSKTAFTKNGHPTLRSITDTPIAPANDMTLYDVNKIRILFGQTTFEEWNTSNSYLIKISLSSLILSLIFHLV